MKRLLTVCAVAFTLLATTATNTCPTCIGVKKDGPPFFSDENNTYYQPNALPEKKQTATTQPERKEKQ